MPSRVEVPREFKFWDEGYFHPFQNLVLVQDSWTQRCSKKFLVKRGSKRPFQELCWNILNQTGSFFHLLIFPIICRNPIKESTDVLERLMSQRNPATRFVESEKITVRKGRKVKNLSIRTKSNTAWRKTIGISQTLFSAVNQEREKLQKIAQVWLISYEAYGMPHTIWLIWYDSHRYDMNHLVNLDDEKHEDTLRRANRKT